MNGRGSTKWPRARLLAFALLVSCLSPGTDAVSSGQGPLARRAAAVDGELRIVIQKSRNVLTLYKGALPLRSYWAALGRGSAQGDKRVEGDKRTPEGEFYICSMGPSERFYKFLGLSYPSINHAEDGMRRGVISYREYLEIWKANTELRRPRWDTKLGGAIGIHGRVRLPAVADTPHPDNWTDGCIAVNNEDLDELLTVASLGMPVTILP